MRARYESWLRQARRDLEYAAKSLEQGYYEWACFAAHQSAEEAVKAVFFKLNAVAWGHSVSALLQQLPAPWSADAHLIDAACELDRHYIPPRYPNAHPEGAPYEYYTCQAAEQAIGYTRDILAFCERVLVGHSRGAETSDKGGQTHGQGPSGD